MNVTYRVDNDILYIALEGRIDATNATEAEEKIFNIKNENTGKHTVVDAENLEYISSAGLRVILRLRKEEPKLAIINVAADVYEVLDMTGFTDMVTIEKHLGLLEELGMGEQKEIYSMFTDMIMKKFNK